jgi:hypothetical protein
MGIYKKQTWWGYNGNIVEISWDINPGKSSQDESTKPSA